MREKWIAKEKFNIVSRGGRVLAEIGIDRFGEAAVTPKLNLPQECVGADAFLYSSAFVASDSLYLQFQLPVDTQIVSICGPGSNNVHATLCIHI